MLRLNHTVTLFVMLEHPPYVNCQEGNDDVSLRTP
jgi:hypothetical protein